MVEEIDLKSNQASLSPSKFELENYTVSRSYSLGHDFG